MGKKYKLTISVNYEECAGCESCVALAPDLFEMSDDARAWPTQAEIIGSKEEIDEIIDRLQEVIDTCPTASIDYNVEEIEE